MFLFLTTNITAVHVTYVTYKPAIAPLKIQLTFFSAKHLPLLPAASKVENYAAADSIVNDFFSFQARGPELSERVLISLVSIQTEY